jgi:hypothetical protein
MEIENPTNDSTQVNFDFHMKEYDRLLDEIARLHKEVFDFERNATIAISAIYVWVSSPSATSVIIKHFAVFVPPLLSYLVFRRKRYSRNAGMIITGYLMKINDEYLQSSPIGGAWSAFYSDAVAKGKSTKWTSFSWLWLGMTFITGFVALLLCITGI